MRDLILDGLAAYRLTRLVRQDTITDPMRDWIEAGSVEMRVVEVGRASGFRPSCTTCGHGEREHAPLSGPGCLPERLCILASCSCREYRPEITAVTADVQPWAFIRDALDCPWCASMWCAIFVVLLRWLPGGRLLRNVLAVAALAGVADYVDDHLTGVVHDVEHDEPVGTAQTE